MKIYNKYIVFIILIFTIFIGIIFFNAPIEDRRAFIPTETGYELDYSIPIFYSLTFSILAFIGSNLIYLSFISIYFIFKKIYFYFKS